MEVATCSELRYLEFIGAEYLARSADGVVCRMIEAVDVIHIGPDLRREEGRIEGRSFGARVTVQPGEIGECKWFRSFWLFSFHLLLPARRRLGERRLRSRAGRELLSGSGLCRWRCRLRLELRLQFLDAGPHALQFSQD